MKQWPRLDLEDTIGDVLRKAMRGTRIDAEALATATNIAARSIEDWLADRGAPDAAEAARLAVSLGMDRQRLQRRAAGVWYPGEVATPLVRRHPQLPHPSNGYVALADLDEPFAAIVDPAGDPESLLARLHERQLEYTYILITHKHDDHCDAAGAVAAAYPDARIVMHEVDAPAIGALAENAIPIRKGDRLPFGTHSAIELIPTPGHTDGSSCFRIGDLLFTGDTLFAGSVGGCFGDRFGYADLLTNIRNELFMLPDATAVLPGHGPPTRIGWERSENPFFSDEDSTT
ncbi:MAG: MBL fold metallo-hydrolase [Candidatus Baltobacteraceae bacterium]